MVLAILFSSKANFVIVTILDVFLFDLSCQELLHFG